jgi:hypothetical protein
VLGINPTKEQIEDWKSAKYNLPIDYSVKAMNQVDKRPVDIWLKSEDGCIVEPLRYAISTQEVVSKSGNYQFVNSVGNFTYSSSEDTLKNNPKMDWFSKYPMRKAFIGEEDVYSFMQALMNYSPNGTGANFLADAENNNITAVELFNGNLSGLVQFVNWCNENGNKVVALAAVRKTEKLSVEGLTKVYYNQAIVPKPEYIFPAIGGTVSNRAINKITNDYNNGVVITNAMFTIPYSLFKESECINNVPINNINITSSNGTAAPSAGLMNFLKS